MNLTGLSHSEISVSKAVCASTELIAAYHVLHRLPVPRHPPSALSSLIENLLALRSNPSNVRAKLHSLLEDTLDALLTCYEVVKDQRLISETDTHQERHNFVGPNFGDDRD